MSEALKSIKCQQKKWAGEENMSPKGYRRKLKDNLFQNLDERTRRDFEKADGGELYGKMNAVHSSSALVCNFFDYWRNRVNTFLAGAMGIEERINSIEFEKKFRTGMKGTPPHLDVVFTLSNQTIFAIESKFTESYHRNKSKNEFAKSYFSDGKKLWKEKELDRCQAEAKRIRESPSRYHHLGAAQLLKHMLGLAKWGKESEKNWTLLYLWFNPGGPESDRHEEEIERFTEAVCRDDGKVSDHGEFCTMTYQELFEKLSKKLGSSHGDYREYLAQRYFPKK